MVVQLDRFNSQYSSLHSVHSSDIVTVLTVITQMIPTSFKQLTDWRHDHPMYLPIHQPLLTARHASTAMYVL